jgi:hypothetical protein
VYYIFFNNILDTILFQTGGFISYTQDDTFIHMAMAKNFAQYGVWGVTRYAFSSTSSSPLYTLLLAGFFGIFGPVDTIPLFINFIVAILILISVDWVLVRERVHWIFRFFTLFGIIYGAALIPVTFAGMEHLLHGLVNFVFIYLAMKIIFEEPPTANQKSSSGHPYQKLTLLLAPVLGLLRFEAMFVIIIITCLFILNKKYLLGCAVGLFGFLPIVVYGLISQAHGWFFFPNPIVMKGDLQNLTGILQDPAALNAFIENKVRILLTQYHVFPLIIFIVLIILALILYRQELWSPMPLMGFIFAGEAIFQAFFAKFSMFYRYDSFLMVLGIATIGLSTRYIPLDNYPLPNNPDPLFNFLRISEEPYGNTLLSQPIGRHLTDNLTSRFSPQKLIIDKKSLQSMLLLALLIGWGAIALEIPYNRGSIGQEHTAQATVNIYQQQVQMSRFLQQYYAGEKIAANDIGAINFYGDIQCFDLAGLGSLEPATNVMQGGDWRARLYQMVEDKGIQIAVVYATWFPGPWVKVAIWSIPNNIVCGYHEVTFYAVNSSRAMELRQNLVDFAPELPPGVTVTYMW